VEVVFMTHMPPDQETAHESVPDEAHVGRFSRGLEAEPPTDEKLHRGKYSEGLEQLPGTEANRHRGRFSEGLAELPAAPVQVRRGSFADGQATHPDDAVTLAPDAGPTEPAGAAEQSDLSA
jgi:hypothetical protein